MLKARRVLLRAFHFSSCDSHGSVKLKIWIAPDGTVRRLEYIGGHPLLAESALKAVKTWKYQPATTESTSQVEIKF
jgi:TonB family protein